MATNKTLKRNVLHIINDLKLGGAQKLVSDLIIGSKNELNSSIIILDSSNSLFDKLLTENGIKITSLFPLSFKNFYEIFKLLKNADILHVHLFPCLYLFAFIPIKKVFTEHNTWNRRRKYHLLKYVEKFIYSKYDGIVSISNNTKEALKLWLGGIPAKFDNVVYNGIDLDKFTVKPLGESGHTIGMMGRFSAQKDQETIIRALKFLPETYTIKFAGSGELINESKILTEELNLNDRVEYLGQISNIENYLNSIDLYIQSSHWEGFGLAPLEAMSKQIPTIGSNVKGLDEVIGDSVYLFSKNDPEELANSILKIYESTDSFINAQKYSFSRAKQFSITKTTEKYLQIYSSIIDG